MFHRFLFAALSVSVGSLQAGEYDKVSFGLQVDFTSVNAANVPFQNAAGNIQGAQADKLYGIGLAAHLRFGEIFSQRLSSLELAPSVIYRFGKVDESQFQPNYNFYSSDGSVTTVQNAEIKRKTSERDIVLFVPLRWYWGGAATYGGFFIDGGPVIASLQQTVDLGVSGLILASPASVQESARITTNTTGFAASIGYTSIYRQSQSTFFVSFQSLKGDNSRKSANELRGGIQWTF